MKKLFRKIGHFFKFIFSKVTSFLGFIFSKIGDFFDLIFTKTKLKNLWRRIPNKRRKAICGYIFILPWLIGLIFFGIEPIAKSIRYAFADVAILQANEETGTRTFKVSGFGLTQFKKLFGNNPEHVTAILNFIKDIVIIVPIVLVFALILALLLNAKVKGKGIFRMIFFIPVILLSGNMLTYFSSYGLLTVPSITNGTITEVINNYFPNFISEVLVNAFGRIVLILWLSGVQTLIFLAGLTKIDKSIYEAAKVDGASAWESFWKITLPSLIPMMLINIVYTTVIYTNLGNYNPIINIISSGMSNEVKYGRAYGSALSWILFGIDLLTIGVYALIVKLANKKFD